MIKRTLLATAATLALFGAGGALAQEKVVNVYNWSDYIDSSIIDDFTKETEVQQCYYVTGEADFILVVSVRAMGDYEALTRRLFFQNNNVKRFRTFVSMDRVKVGLSIPLG